MAQKTILTGMGYAVCCNQPNGDRALSGVHFGDIVMYLLQHDDRVIMLPIASYPYPDSLDSVNSNGMWNQRRLIDSKQFESYFAVADTDDKFSGNDIITVGETGYLHCTEIDQRNIQ